MKMTASEELHLLCLNGKEDNGTTWDPVREWLSQASSYFKGTTAATTAASSRIVDCLQHAPAPTHQTPLHIACWQGAPVDVVTSMLEVLALLPENKGVVDERDYQGQTPLHLVCRHAFRASSPDLVNLLLQHAPKSAIIPDDQGQWALSYLGQEPSGPEMHESTLQKQKEGRIPASKCFDVYLKQLFAAETKNRQNDNQNPQNEESAVMKRRSPENGPLFQILDAYPDWLQRHALLHPTVQDCLNKAMADPFFTSVIMLDLMFLIWIIAILQVIAMKNLPISEEGTGNSYSTTAALLLAASHYFFSRNVSHYFTSIFLRGKLPELTPDTLINITLIGILLYLVAVVLMAADQEEENDQVLTIVLLLASYLTWVQMLAFMRHGSIEFSLFAAGVIDVIPKIFAFLLTLGILLLAFAQMLLIATRGSSDDDVAALCLPSTTTMDNRDEGHATGSLPFTAFCTFGPALLRVYTMSVGEVEESDFDHSFLAKFVYAFFLMIMVILLANVLAYLIGNEIYHHERHALRFWENRLEYVLAMDSISSSGPFAWLRKLYYLEDKNGGGQRSRRICNDLLAELKNHQFHVCSCNFWRYMFLRLVVLVIIFPCWFCLGLVSAGYLWPPQLREYLFYTPPYDDKNDTNAERDAISAAPVSNDSNVADVSNIVQSLKSEMNSVRGDVHNLEKKLDELLMLLREKRD